MVVSTALSTKLSVPVAATPPPDRLGPNHQLVVQVILDERQIRGRDGEAHQDGPELVDRDQWLGGVGPDQIPLPHEQTAGAARDRGPDGGVLEVEPRLVTAAWLPARVAVAAAAVVRARSYCCAVTYSFSASSAYRFTSDRAFVRLGPVALEHAPPPAPSAAWKGRGSS